MSETTRESRFYKKHKQTSFQRYPIKLKRYREKKYKQISRILKEPNTITTNFKLMKTKYNSFQGSKPKSSYFI